MSDEEDKIPDYLKITPEQEEFIHKFAARWKARVEEKRLAAEAKVKGDTSC